MIDQGIPIYREGGKRVGYVLGDTFVKSVTLKEHLYRTRDAWCYDIAILESAVMDHGVTELWLNCTDEGERGTVYTINVDSFYEHRFKDGLDWPGQGKQWGVPRRYWRKRDAEGQQADMFDK